MRRAFERLYGKIKPVSVRPIFFSGFGIQANRQSYMIPIDAQIWAEADVRRDGFSLENVLGVQFVAATAIASACAPAGVPESADRPGRYQYLFLSARK